MSKTSSNHPDVIVVGLGAMGSASLYHLAARGVNVLGLDRFNPPHNRGSSHGETRITRLVTGEGDVFVPIVRRSHELWRELEAATGEDLFSQTGVLYLGSKDGALIERVTGVAQRTHIEHQRLSHTELEQRFPQFRLQHETAGLFDPAGGTLFPERCIAVQLQLARQQGAEIHTDETVLTVAPNATGVRVTTKRGEYHAGQVVLTAGPWLPQLVGGAFPQLLRVYRQVLYWFATEHPADFTPNRFPVFIWGHGADKGFYGFPSFTPDRTVKVATSQLVTETAPDAVDRLVMADEIMAMYQTHIAGLLPGLAPQVLRTATCLYTVTPDGHFVFDQQLDAPQVLLVSACSGHGFKHSAAIGEAVAQHLVTEQTALDLSSFTLSRFHEYLNSAVQAA
ncbi:MAG: N-methyl-L-tryptophan oxidase [Caldilineaceae bacterium]